MKTLILYHSEHHGNTEKVAHAISKVFGVKSQRAESAEVNDLTLYDVVGFGSGIYNGRFHQNMYQLIAKFSNQKGKKAFLFSTTGSMSYSARAHEQFKTELQGKGFKVIGEFSCPGFDTALSSEGINRGRPNAEDLKNAEKFAQAIRSK